MQRITGNELLGTAVVGRCGGQRVAAGVPGLLVGSDDLARLGFIDTREQAAADDLDGLVVLGRVDHGGLARDDAVGLGQERCDRLVLT